MSSVGWGLGTADEHVEPLTVVEADPPRLFSFRWVFDEGTRRARPLLVTFELVPSGDGTLLRMTETGFREKGWEIATLEAAYADHVEGWDRFVPGHRGVRRRAGVDAMSVAVDDDLWSAIGDPTRRRMLDLLLADGAGTATTLSDSLPVTRQAVAKHLVVLDRVGLVHVTPAGRERRYRVDEVAARPRGGSAGRRRGGVGRPPAADQADRRGDRAQSEDSDEKKRRSRWWTSFTGSA